MLLLHQYTKRALQQWRQSYKFLLICYNAYLSIDVHCSRHLKRKNKIFFFSFFYSHLTVLSLTLKLPSEKFLSSSYFSETPKPTLTISLETHHLLSSSSQTNVVPTEAWPIAVPATDRLSACLPISVASQDPRRHQSYLTRPTPASVLLHQTHAADQSACSPIRWLPSDFLFCLVWVEEKNWRFGFFFFFFFCLLCTTASGVGGGGGGYGCGWWERWLWPVLCIFF